MKAYGVSERGVRMDKSRAPAFWADMDNEFYKHVLTSMENPFFIVDPDFRLLFVNRAAEQLLGRTLEECVGPVSYTHLDVYKRQLHTWYLFLSFYLALLISNAIIILSYPAVNRPKKAKEGRQTPPFSYK